MAKKSKLLKRLDAQAAAETEARKQKALAEGQYAVNPDTGKAMGETPIIAQEQVVETVNTPGFENTSLVKSPDSKRTLASALDVQTQNQNVSSAISSGNVGKMGQLGITPKFSNEQIDANLPILDANEVIAQKENADQMVQSDSALAKLQANTPEEVAAIYSATQELQQKTESEEAERRLKWDIAVLQSEGQQNEPSEVEGNDDLEYERLNLEREKHNDDVNLKRDVLNETRRTNKVKEEQKNREITIKAKQPQTKAK